MNLYLLFIGFIVTGGDFEGSIYVVEECPPIEMVITEIRERVEKGGVLYWTAKCSDFDFVPFEMPRNINRT